jgi:hypothetical protein
LRGIEYPLSKWGRRDHDLFQFGNPVVNRGGGLTMRRDGDGGGHDTGSEGFFHGRGM